MVYPNVQCYHFCYWMLNVSWQTLTPPRLTLIQTVYTAASTGASVTDVEFNNFTQITAWRFPYYTVWANTSGSPPLEAFAYFQKWSVQPSSTFQSYVWTFINTLKSANQWQYLTAFWLLAVPTSDGALINMANPSLPPASLISTPTFTANQGYSGASATKCINSNFTPGVDDSATISNLEFGAYMRTNVNSLTRLLGSSNAADTQRTYISPRNGADMAVYGIASVDSTTVANLNSQGFWSAKRFTSQQTVLLARGVPFATQTLASTALSAFPFYILAHNNAGAINKPTTGELSAAYVSKAQMNTLILYNAVQALMTSIGCQV